MHTLIGVFIAPSVVFFAVTGAYQLFGFHEAKPGATHQPAKILMQLSSVHKDQVFAVEHHGPAPASMPAPNPHEGAAGAPRGRHDDDHGSIGSLLLKFYFLGIALGLVVSTGFGVWMALRFARSRRNLIALMVASSAIPLLLLLV